MESTSLRVMLLTADCLTILIVDDDTTGIDGGVLEPMPCVAKANSTAAKNALEGILRRPPSHPFCDSLDLSGGAQWVMIAAPPSR